MTKLSTLYSLATAPDVDDCLPPACSRSMPSQGPQWTEFLSCEVCCKLFSENANRPISLGCGHTVCKQCLSHLKQSKCPFDQSPINCDIDKLPVNYALLQLIGAAIPDKLVDSNVVGDISDAKKTECYESARRCIEELAVYLKPLSEDSLNELEKNHEDLTELKVNKSSHLPQLLHTQGGRTIPTQPSHGAACVLSRPMQRKLLVLINCQLVEEEGRSRAARAARSLGERTVTELILAHQNPQQLSANLWAAVRTRGCQFLGPGMQEEVLRLILLALEDGSALSRKVLVLFVVQRLEKQYPQASKTAIGHVVQLLYRASCFKVTKREEESSLMQLKEEFRTYETLRLEHDAQIVQIAMEAGLRISPEQWSSLLYGDASHKSHMQSIIDKHQNPQSFTQGIVELVLVLQRLGDPTNLSRLRPHLEFLAKIDPSPDCPAPSWEDLEAVMKSLKIVVQGLVDFVKRYNHRRLEVTPPQNTRYKTSMCRDFIAKGSCPRGATCTFAHSQEELEQYRSRSKKLSQRYGTMYGMIAKLDGSLSDDGMLLTKDAEKASDQEDEPKIVKPNHSIGANPLAGLVSPLSAVSLNPAQPSRLLTSPGMPPQPPLSMPLGLPDMGQPPALHPFPLSTVSQPPAPGMVYPLLSQPLTLQAPSGPSLRMPFPTLQDGMVPQVMLPRGLADLGVPYQGGHHNPGLPPSILGSAPPAFLPGTVPPPPPPPPPPLSSARPPELQSFLAAGDRVQVGAAGMFPGSVLAPEAFGLSSADLHAATLPGVNMQSLEKLRNRKLELIAHLQSEWNLSGGTCPSLGRSQLEQVLSTWPRPAADPLSKSINNTFVAMRATSTLDDYGNETRKIFSADHLNGETFPGYSQLASAGSVYARIQSTEAAGASSLKPPSQDPILQTASRVIPTASLHKAKTEAARCLDVKADSSEHCSGVDLDSEVIKIVQSTLDSEEIEDDFFIPFDPPLVSKYGPISRNMRMKIRNTAPVNVTAEEGTKTCNSVLTVTPLHRPYPTSVLVPSMYDRPLSSHTAANVLLTTALPPPASQSATAATVYSPWSGLDFWQRQIPEMVQNLEKSAIQANTTSERLALQLQSVELQIFMGMLNNLAAASSLLQKTGENPKPVSQLLQEASVDLERLTAAPPCLGSVYMGSNDALIMHPRSDYSDRQ